MNPQKFVAANVTEALKQVTQKVGGDAIVLTTRDTSEGVEIIAIAPADLAQLAQGNSQPSVAPLAPVTPQPMPVVQHPIAPDFRPANAVSVAEMDHLLSEFAHVKQLLQTHLSEKVWGDMQMHHPQQAEALRVVLNAGFSPALSAELVKALAPSPGTGPMLRQCLQNILEQRVKVIDPLSVFDAGGVFVFIGPTGVGKTTAIAKIAARCVLRYGREQLALLTTDTFRIGAQEQLNVYAKIIGVPVASVRDSDDLAAKLKSMGHRRIILLDTAGVNQRDAKMLEQAQMLQQGAPSLKRILVMSSTTDLRTQEDVILMHQDAGMPDQAQTIHAAIMTKTDEAAQLGPVLDCLIRHELPLMFLANGQRVPEDLSQANLSYLSHRAIHPRALGHQMALADAQLPALMADQLSQWALAR